MAPLGLDPALLGDPLSQPDEHLGNARASPELRGNEGKQREPGCCYSRRGAAICVALIAALQTDSGGSNHRPDEPTARGVGYAQSSLGKSRSVPAPVRDHVEDVPDRPDRVDVARLGVLVSWGKQELRCR